MPHTTVAYQWEAGVIDSFELIPLGIIRLHEWLNDNDHLYQELPELRLHNKAVQPNHRFRTRRDDVAAALGGGDLYRGLTLYLQRQFVLPNLLQILTAAYQCEITRLAQPDLT